MTVADSVLVQRALSGDLEGFGELHRRYYKKVVNVVFGIMRERARAEDMVQDAYVSALKDLPRLNDPNRFYPWLCRIAVNRAIEEKRKSSRRARWVGDSTEGGKDESSWPSRDPSVLDELVEGERAERVQAALNHLPDGQRAAVVLRYFDGLAMRNIAVILGCEEVTARSQVFRGLRRLGAVLRQMAPEDKPENLQ
jgi:RNA polymerase sigma-70 factor (ECF subfamily)